MAISVSCKCGNSLRVRDEAAGKKLCCPRCKSAIQIPSADTGDTVSRGDLQESCPSCRRPLLKNGVICLNCGYEVRTRKTAGPKKSKKAKGTSRQTRGKILLLSLAIAGTLAGICVVASVLTSISRNAITHRDKPGGEKEPHEEPIRQRQTGRLFTGSPLVATELFMKQGTDAVPDLIQALESKSATFRVTYRKPTSTDRWGAISIAGANPLPIDQKRFLLSMEGMEETTTPLSQLAGRVYFSLNLTFFDGKKRKITFESGGAGLNCWATLALARIGPPAVSHLVASAKKGDNDVRRNAFWALGKIASEDVVLVLADLSQNDDDEQIRRFALDTLVDAVQGIAIGTQSDEVTDTFRKLLENGSANEDLRRVVSQVLVEMETDPQQRAHDLLAMLKTEDVERRLLAIELIGKLKPRANEVIPALADVLDSEDASHTKSAQVTNETIKTLLLLEDSQATAAVLDWVLKLPWPKGEQAPLAQFRKDFESSPRGRLLMSRIGNQHVQKATFVGRTIKEIGADDRVTAILPILENADVRDRQLAIIMLMHSGDRSLKTIASVFDSLEETLGDHKDMSSYRKLAISSLGEHTDGSAFVAWLIQFIQSDVEDMGVKHNAIGALEQLGPAAAQAIDVLRDIEKTGDTSLRGRARKALREIESQ